MRLLALIVPLSVIAVITFAAHESKPPSFPSLMAFEHHDSTRSQLVAQANFKGAVVRDPVSLPDEDGQATVLRWQWLKETTWYVPARNPLGFYLVNAQTVIPVVDQTVYHITDYREGFFWGKLVKKLSGSPASCLSMIGSVTPEGWIQMSLVSQDTGAEAVVSRGTGIMRFKSGAWTMEWQGASGPDAATQYSHWAYMTLTHPGLPSWDNLPFVNMSVPDFIAQCPGNGPTLVEP